MYLKYYGFTSQPFQLTLDRLCVYFGSQQKEVVAQLLYGLREQKGLMVLEGEPGTGKTTLLDLVVALLPSHRNVYPCWIRNPLLRDPIDLLEAILRGFGQTCDRSARISEVTEQLMRLLTRCRLAGTTPVLLIDEAQVLGSEAMEQVRVLTNWEQDSRKLLQIILAGQPELGRRYLDAPEQEALRQRVALRCHLDRMTAGETADYIRLRLKEAGCSRSDLLDAGAMREIHRYSGGVPRKINVLADHCLVAGFAAQAAAIRADLVVSVAGDLHLPALITEVPEVPEEGAALTEQYQLSDLFRAFLGEEEVLSPEMSAGRN